MDFLEHLILSPGLTVGISGGSRVVTCLSQFSPLKRPQGQQSLCNLLWAGWGWGPGLLGFQGTGESRGHFSESTHFL